MAKEYTNEYLKYAFDEDEKKDLAIEMARKLAEIQSVEDTKKAVVSDFKSRIDQLNSDVNGAAIKLNNGYEYREVKCEKVKDFEDQIISFIRCDTFETVKTVKMKASDFQESFIE